ncbi:MAG TPA: glycosyltransferase family 4 protein [Clostridiales bacterium]|nr:glycosyltransferase family 4 protein [Clostridiales bacterium]
MKVLLLSIIAKCGVFTHVRELSLYLQKLGTKVVIGFIHNEKTMEKFKLSDADLDAMTKSLKGVDYFFYESDDDLLNKINDMKISLVHAHSPLVLSAAIKASDKLDIPFVLTLHSTLNWCKLHPISMEKADCIIAIGPEVAKSAGDCHQEKIHVIFNGIDLEHYKPMENINVNGPLRIIWMGRTNGEVSHGAQYLARAVRILRKKGISLDAKIIGHAVGANIEGMKNYSWVHDPLPYLLRNHIVFARGRALREAMACGNVGILIGQGYGGIVREDWFGKGRIPQLSGSIKHGYDKLDVSMIIKDILYFHKNREELSKAKRAARKIAEKYFDVRKMAEQTENVYLKAIKLHSQKKVDGNKVKKTKS